MERHVEEDVDGWPTRPIDGGYDGLRQLAAAEFSGAVRARGACLFMLNGRIVGVFDGSLEDFDGASGTAHKAPHPSLPLLYAMQERGGETRGKYYTNDTPISEVHETLSGSGFTGYVELSENVLSGDYYLVYHAGNAMSLAFIGNSGRLVTGDEAFDRADDEVGIYEVNEVDVDVRDVPGLEAGDGAGEDEAEASRGDAGAVDEGERDAEATHAGEADAVDEGEADAEAVDEGEADADATHADRPDEAEADAGGRSESDAAATADDATTDSSDDADQGEAPAATDDAADVGTASAGATAAEARTEPAARDDESASSQAATPATPEEPSAEDREAADAGGSEGPSAGERRADREPVTDDGASAAEAVADEQPGATNGVDADARTTAADVGGATGREDESERTGATADADATGTDARAAGGEGASRGATTAGSTERESARRSRSTARTDEHSGTDRTQPAASGAASETEADSADLTTIPSLDPDRTAEVPVDAAAAQRTGGGTTPDASRERTAADTSPGAVEESAEVMDETFEEEVLEREDRIDRLEQRVSNLQTERDDVADERDRLAERVSELEAENEELRAEIQDLERQLEAGTSADAAAGQPATPDASATASAGPEELRPRGALEETDLFVRYDSKGAATLEDAHDGTADADEVDENLRLDLHTRFDADQATVDGEPFREFLEDTMAYRFVDWLVRRLPYEVRDTGSEAELRDLYDALPEVDRVEFYGQIELTYQEDGETVQAEEEFDVVVRDRMGEALFVADLNDSRDPADADMLVDLQSGATRVKETTGALAGAFAVTRSFFDPDALETAAEATGGSLLSRDSRKSYVKVSRKRGYHLCLVEARGEDLHLNVPEL